MQNKSFFTEKKLREERDSSLLKLKFITTISELKNFEKTYLRTKLSTIPLFIQKLIELPLEERKKVSKFVNQWKKELLVSIEQLRDNLINSNREETEEVIKDLSLEGKRIVVASPHPITKMISEVYDFFIKHGYQIYESPEVDSQWYNFSSLNIIDHPSRSDKDTFYLNIQNENSDLLLRTHTSNSQVRILEKNKDKEIKIVSIGKVYRCDDDDATHSHQYTNCELIVVGKKISLVNLKGTLEVFFKWIFNSDVKIRLRPSFFPFTEPSFEVDCTCLNCKTSGDNCSVCKGSGWIEVLGAGLIHPEVLKNSGYDPQLFTGFAAGIGIERIIMIKNGINDIRDLYLNDLRFLKQTKWR